MKQSIRSFVVVAFISSAALTACGKDVKKTPGGANPQQDSQITTPTTPTTTTVVPTIDARPSLAPVPPTGTTPSMANCPDPISRPNAKLLDFEALGMEKGTFELETFKAYSVLVLNAGSAQPTTVASALEGKVSGSSIELKSICQDVSQFPRQAYSWVGRFPEKFDAVKGAVETDTIVMETVSGAMDPSAGRGVESSSQNLVCLLATPCANAAAYQLDDSHVAILRETETTGGNGELRYVKTLSVYVLKGGVAREEEGGETGGGKSSKQEEKKGGKSSKQEEKKGGKSSKQDENKGANNGANNGSNNGNNGANNGANKGNEKNSKQEENKGANNGANNGANKGNEKNSKQEEKKSKQD